MCEDCLNNIIADIELYQYEIRDYLCNNPCECCSVFPKFLCGLCDDLKVLIYTKKRKNNQVCLKGFLKLTHFEETKKTNIKHKLNLGLEKIDEVKHHMKENSYLIKMNQLKEINNWFESIEEADHR